MKGLEISLVPCGRLEFSGRIDAEYYRPKFIEIESAVTALGGKPLGQLANFLIGPFGSAFTVENFTNQSAFRYIRGKDVKPLRLLDGDNVFMPEEDYKRLEKYALKSEDILISVVGTLGNAALVTSKDLPAIFSCKSTAIRAHKINSAYLTVYLNCRFGRELTLRKERGAIQKGLNLDDLKDIPVFLASSGFQEEIQNAFQLALEQTEISKNELKLAEAALLAALGIGAWTASEPLTYTGRARDIFASGRLDAQYFMPAKEQVRQSLAALQGQPLSDRVDSIREQWLPERAAQNMLVRNYDVTDALVPLLDAEKEPTPAADIGSMKKVLRDGDVAVSRLRAYLKEIAVVRTSGDMPSMGSSEFIVLRPKGEAISPEALMVFLRSAPVQTILKWCQDGSQHPRFSESDLLSIPMPDAVAAVSAEITSIVQQSFAARRRASQLLDAAKRAVEIAIEDSEAAAIAYLSQAEEAA